MQIYIHRDNEDFGPYSREAVLEYVKQGVFEAMDHACYAGMSEWKTVGELLGIAGSGTKFGKGAKQPSSSKITEFNTALLPQPPAQRRQRSRGYAPAARAKKGFMIVVNVILIAIVILVAYVRFGRGGYVVRRYLGVISGELAKLAGNPPDAAGNPGAAASPDNPRSETSAINPPSSAVVAPVPLAGQSAASGSATAVVLSAAQTSGSGVQAAAGTSQASSTPSGTLAMNSASAPGSAPASPAGSVAPPPAQAPTPSKPFEPSDIAGNPAAWPRTLQLKTAVNFPAYFNGQPVGSVTAPIGSTVRLTNIQGDQLTVAYQSGTQQLSWKLTDLGERMTGVAIAPEIIPGLGAALTTPASSAANGSVGDH